MGFDGVVLTIDLGTTRTKAAVWDGDQALAAVGRARLVTDHPAADRAEQDPAAWWTAVVEACAAARAKAPATFAAVGAVGFSTARQTFVPVTATGEPLGPALLWSDRRAGVEAAALASANGGPDQVRSATGAALEGGRVAAKVAWLAAHEPDRLVASRWLLGPRDLIVWRLTGEVTTDETVASATGLYDSAGALVAGLAGQAAGRVPEAVAPTTIVGGLRPGPAAQLGLRVAIPVVVGAGDRQCEVLGVGASPTTAMVSWGTTANASIPVESWPADVGGGINVTRGARGGWLLEGGVSAAGSLIEWLAAITGVGVEALGARAEASPPGADGVVAVPWLGGARAPWWRDGVGAAFVGLSGGHGVGEMARAAIESVALDVARCLELMGSATGVAPTSLALAGGGADLPVWVSALTGLTGVGAVRRRSAQAASVGAFMITTLALGGGEVEVDRVNPIETSAVADPATVSLYRDLRPAADQVAAAILGLSGPVV